VKADLWVAAWLDEYQQMINASVLMRIPIPFYGVMQLKQRVIPSDLAIPLLFNAAECDNGPVLKFKRLHGIISRFSS